jgi:hypothetical protein
MKLRTLALAAGISAPLITPAPADAGFVGIYTVTKPNPYNLMTVNVYAEFDNPGADQMQSVAGTPEHPMNITAVGGSFYNHTFGSDQAPMAALVAAFPELAFDSFFTIGRKVIDPPGADLNQLNLVNMPPLDGSLVHAINGSWGLVPPTSTQGDPFDPVNSFPGNGSVLIAQFSMDLTDVDLDQPYGIQGSFIVCYTADGGVWCSYVSFESIEGIDCTDDAFCDDGDPCNGAETCDLDTGDCLPGVPDPDCNGNGILDSCDIAAGTSTDANGNGVPDDCDVLCPGDLDGDGQVGVTDVLRLFQLWGPCF